MCGRFTLTELEPDVLTEIFTLSGDLPTLAPRYNIAPTQPVATVIHDPRRTENRLGFMRWGLIPSWAKDPAIGSRLINARGETVHEKPSFRAAFRRRRCLIVANGFYEWQKQDDGPKQPVYITLTDDKPFAFAGLWEMWTDRTSGSELVTCTIITTGPNDLVRPIHNRMPVILPREDYARWLTTDDRDADSLLPLLRPYPAEHMTAWPVSRRVNSPANDDPTLLDEAS